MTSCVNTFVRLFGRMYYTLEGWSLYEKLTYNQLKSLSLEVMTGPIC